MRRVDAAVFVESQRYGTLEDVGEAWAAQTDSHDQFGTHRKVLLITILITTLITTDIVAVIA